MQCDSRKVVIVGLGNVGVTAAFTLLVSDSVDEIVMLSRSVDKAYGHKLDLEHGMPFLNPVKITATDDYATVAGADVVIIAAGVGQKPGQTRLDLVEANKKIFDEIIPQLKPYVENSTILIVSNPVDILTYYATKLFELPAGRVLGTGTMLDTARFRFHLSEFMTVNSKSIHAYILGEHGDSSFPVLSSANIGGQPLQQFPEYSEARAIEAFEQAKTAAYKIIESKGATFYAIAVVIKHAVQSILHDQRSVLPVTSVLSKDYYGEKDVAISVPCVIGRNGVLSTLQVPLSEKEQKKFAQSAEIIRGFNY
ncbi:MAG: L-lactate dehydrogenase [Microgenomates group bacterium]